MLLRYRQGIEIIHGMRMFRELVRVRRFNFRLSLIITGDFSSRRHYEAA